MQTFSLHGQNWTELRGGYNHEDMKRLEGRGGGGGGGGEIVRVECGRFLAAGGASSFQLLQLPWTSCKLCGLLTSLFFFFYLVSTLGRKGGLAM